MTVNVSLPANVTVSIPGAQGPRGNTTLNGLGTPTSTVGIDGDWYYDLTAYPSTVTLYGPKAAGAWPAQGVVIGGGGTAGALLAANNLGDVQDTPTARGNLGLGAAAVRNVGTTTGTCAAGDDARFTEIVGLPVTGTPATGKAPVCTSGSALAWTTISGGGGGVTPVFYDDPVGAGIVTLTTVADWTPVIGTGGKHVGRTIPARAGDVILWSPSFLRTGTTMFLDAVIRAGDGTISRFVSSGTTTPNVEGYAPWYAQSGSFPGVGGTRAFTVQPGEIDPSGNWTLEMIYKGGDDTCRVYFGDGYDGYWPLIRWPLGT
ncbi:hypothetical protein [Actinacidiphila acididurans]|uniref:Uncharacterized protein n=1 Tax=Actinacidiphila acididurans TaxID=2784346 RepID=A0ABS2U311_9ACTN|nr:hypothetical protein [Actinacidiphila acididurans]MBM9509980.1 hypothetical protein [Actinacidiphila acididurans]